MAEETLAEADRDNRHRRRLITAGRRLARSGLPTEALEKKAVGYDEVKTKAAPVCHRSIEPAVNCGIQFTGSHLNVQELVDPLLKRRIARHQVGFLSEIKRLIRVHAAKLRMQLVLQPPFCGIGDHHVGKAGHQLVENTRVVRKHDNVGVPQMCAIERFIGRPGRSNDAQPACRFR